MLKIIYILSYYYETEFPVKNNQPFKNLIVNLSLCYVYYDQILNSVFFVNFCILEGIVGLNDLSLCFQFLSQNKTKQKHIYMCVNNFATVSSKTEVL